MRKYKKDSVDYQVNLVSLWELEEMVPMYKRERDALRSWVKAGYNIEDNPWHYTDASGYPLDYLLAYRERYGFYHGPEKYWNMPAPWDGFNEGNN